MVDAVSGEGELSDSVSNNTDAPAGFKSDMWKYFGFAIWKHEKGEKTTKNSMTPRSHRGHFKVQSLFNECFFFTSFQLFSILVSVFFF